MKSVHCIGDRANQIVLDIYEDIIKNDADPKISAAWRPRIEHAVMLTPQDLERVGRLGGELRFRELCCHNNDCLGSHCQRAAHSSVRSVSPH